MSEEIKGKETGEKEMNTDENISLDEVVKMLDGFAASNVSRLKIDVSETQKQGEVTKQYHHGRCDVNSPFAKGCAFDVLDTED